MQRLKLIVFIILCTLVNFAHSEKLPNKIISQYEMIFEKSEFDKKIKSRNVSVSSYNTWGLPISLPDYDQERRFNAMSESLLQLGSDIIGLQEVFHPALRTQLLNKLPQHYYTFSDYRCNRNVAPFIEMDCYGGLMTLSKFPIVNEQFIQYPKLPGTSIIEKIGSKGFLISQIMHGKNIINVVNTHLYAGDNVAAEKMRMHQIKYLFETISHEQNFKKYNTIMIGDFNVHHPYVAYSEVYNFIVNSMMFHDSKPMIDSLDFTIDHINNDFVDQKETRTKLDYIFFKNHGNCPFEVYQQSRIMVTEKPLSDHFGWNVLLKI